MFNFEKALKESIDSSIKESKFQQYLDMYSKEVVCLKAEDGTFLSESGNILDNQSRFYALVEMGGIIEGKIVTDTSDTDLKIFLESKEL